MEQGYALLAILLLAVGCAAVHTVEPEYVFVNSTCSGASPPAMLVALVGYSPLQ